jgi:hypothetical protein
MGLVSPVLQLGSPQFLFLQPQFQLQTAILLLLEKQLNYHCTQMHFR